MVSALEKKQTFSLDSDEFKKAVQQAAAEAVATAMAAVQKNSDYDQIGKSFAVEMAKFTGASDGKHYVDPEIVSYRLECRKELDEMISEIKEKYKSTQDKRDVPKYKLVNKTFLGGQILYPSIVGPGGNYVPREIGWLDIPNEAMVPVNSVARKIFDKFKESIGLIQDPASTEDIWINEQGVAKYGKNPNEYNKKPQVNLNPNLVDLNDQSDEASKYAVFNGMRPPSMADVGLAFVN